MSGTPNLSIDTDPELASLERCMSIHQTRRTAGQLILKKYRQRGVVAGGGLGLLIGVLVSGPHFYEWSLISIVAVVFGSAAAGAAIGWLFASAVAGSVSSDPAYGEGPENIGDGDTPGGDANV